jgi:putative ABC transport system permease protein
VTSRHNEPNVTLFAAEPEALNGFGAISGSNGRTVGLEALGRGEVYINADAADDLDASVGDQLALFAAGRRSMLTVKDVVRFDGTGTDSGALLMPLSQAQRALGVGDRVQQVLVSNDGDAVSGASRTDQVVSALQPTVARLGLQVDKVKGDGLKLADTQGATYLSLFSTFGTFTIAGGDPADLLGVRHARHPNGAARWAPLARSAHSVATWFRCSFSRASRTTSWRPSLARPSACFWHFSWCMSWPEHSSSRGWSLFATTSAGRATSRLSPSGFFSRWPWCWLRAWRVSRLNIVAAIRNLPQPPRQHRRRSRWVITVACLAGGGALVASAYSTKNAPSLLVGGTLLITALAPMVLMLGVSERAAYTTVGMATLAWNLLPFKVYGWLVPGLTMGFSVFLLAGMLLVAGATCVVMYNLRGLLPGLMLLFGRSRRGAPVVKVAVAEPMRSRFRTGATLGLFTLVVFTP